MNTLYSVRFLPLGLALFAGLSLAAARPAAAQAVGNAGFEAPNVGGGSGAYRYSDDLAGQAPVFSAAESAQTVWSFSGNSGISGNGSEFTSGNPAAPEGSQVAFLQNGGSFSQTITGFAGGAYAFTFEAAQRGNYNPDGPQAFSVSLDGALLGDFTPVSAAYDTFSTGYVPVTAGDHTLTFTGLTASGDHTAFVDNVGVAAPVPESSTTVSLGLLLALGMGGVVVAKKRKA